MTDEAVNEYITFRKRQKGERKNDKHSDIRLEGF